MMKAKNRQNSIKKTNSVVQSTKGMIGMDSDLKRILSGPQSNAYSEEKMPESEHNMINKIR